MLPNGSGTPRTQKEVFIGTGGDPWNGGGGGPGLRQLAVDLSRGGPGNDGGSLRTGSASWGGSPVRIVYKVRNSWREVHDQRTPGGSHIGYFGISRHYAHVTPDTLRQDRTLGDLETTSSPWLKEVRSIHMPDWDRRIAHGPQRPGTGPAPDHVLGRAVPGPPR